MTGSPVRRLQPDLLFELALGGLQRRLLVDVELSGRQLEQVVDPDRFAPLANHEEALLVVGDDRDRSGVRDDLALAGRAALGLEGVDPHA